LRVVARACAVVNLPGVFPSFGVVVLGVEVEEEACPLGSILSNFFLALEILSFYHQRYPKVRIRGRYHSNNIQFPLLVIYT